MVPIAYHRQLLTWVEEISPKRIYKQAKITNKFESIFPLAVYLFDIFLDNHDIDLQRLRLVSTTCVRLAAKLEEGTFLVPCMDNFNIGVKSFGLFIECQQFTLIRSIRIFFAAIEYPRKETILMEMMVLSIFDFNINIPTVATFCLYFLEYGVDENEFQENRLQHSSFKEMKKSVKATTMALLENSLFGK